MRRLDGGERTWAKSLREMQFGETVDFYFFFKKENSKYEIFRVL